MGVAAPSYLLSNPKRRVFLDLHPLLEPAFEDSPLSTDFESGDLPMLDHPVQSALGYL